MKTATATIFLSLAITTAYLAQPAKVSLSQSSGPSLKSTADRSKIRNLIDAMGPLTWTEDSLRALAKEGDKAPSDLSIEISMTTDVGKRQTAVQALQYLKNVDDRFALASLFASDRENPVAYRAVLTFKTLKGEPVEIQMKFRPIILQYMRLGPSTLQTPAFSVANHVPDPIYLPVLKLCLNSRYVGSGDEANIIGAIAKIDRKEALKVVADRKELLRRSAEDAFKSTGAGY